MVCCDLFDQGAPSLTLANASELAPWLDTGSFIYTPHDNGYKNVPDLKLPTVRAHGVVCGDFNHNGHLDLAFVAFDNPEKALRAYPDI
jgi:hypothetical protein